MNLVSVSRCLCFRGVTVLLLIYSCCDCSTVINITATSGDPAVLPCSCPTAHPPFFVWQKVVGQIRESVNCYSNDANECKIHQKYQNRTQVIIETGNCSLVFNNVSLSDEGLYECYYQERPLRDEKIYLKVTASMKCKESDGQYHCQLPELHPEGKIVWRRDGQLVPLSVQCTKDPTTGLCDTSDSITLNGTNMAQKLTCEVTKSSGNNIVTCTQDSEPVTHNALMTSSVCVFLTVLLVIVAVFVGIMCRRKTRGRIATPGRII